MIDWECNKTKSYCLFVRAAEDSVTYLNFSLEDRGPKPLNIIYKVRESNKHLQFPSSPALASCYITIINLSTRVQMWHKVIQSDEIAMFVYLQVENMGVKGLPVSVTLNLPCQTTHVILTPHSFIMQEVHHSFISSYHQIIMCLMNKHLLFFSPELSAVQLQSRSTGKRSCIFCDCMLIAGVKISRERCC